jgi:hypothetical protein
MEYILLFKTKNKSDLADMIHLICYIPFHS